jgi:hypothetical protein
MEDIKIGRATATQMTLVAAPASVQVIGTGRSRICLVFSSFNISAGAAIRIWPQRAGGAAFTGGIVINPSIPNIECPLHIYGDALNDPWFAAITGAAGDLTITESTLQATKSSEL